MKPNYSVTSVKIEDGIKKRLKVIAIKKGIKLQDLINDILKSALEKLSAEKND